LTHYFFFCVLFDKPYMQLCDRWAAGGSVMMIHSLYHHPYKGYISAMCFSSSIAP
jgi:hypothetical protein